MRSTALRAAAACLLLALASGTAGCASLAFLPGVEGPEDLRRKAEEALRERKLEEAYAHYAAIRRRHPGSETSSEVFERAAWLYRKIWYRYRFAEERGERWKGSEKAFMYDWLAHECREHFPQQKVHMFLAQMPWPFWQDFRAYAESDPRLAQWEIRVREDNGRIQEVWAAAGGSGPDA